MSSFTPHSKRFKLSPRPLQGTPVKPLYIGKHATVNCHTCNRSMVPRVVSYYGQPLRSICPFCGTTFMKFPSGLTAIDKAISNTPFVICSLSMVNAGYARFGLALVCQCLGKVTSKLISFCSIRNHWFWADGIGRIVCAMFGASGY